MKKIGIAGLGIMGRGMADNFLKNKHEVFVWNRTKSVADILIKKGAVICSSPAEVANKADIIFEVTANDKSSKKVWVGSNGILKGADKNKVLVASATLSIDWTDKLIDECKKKGFSFLDIPLTGGRIGTETGKLTLLCGGKKTTLNKIRPALRAISAKIFHFGLEGHGMRYKLILNYLQGLHMVGFGQAMKMAKKGKMNLKKVAEVLADRPGGAITEIATSGYFKDPDPVTFSIEWITKDITYAKKFAKNLDVPLLDAVLKEYKKAIKKGYKDKDWASAKSLE